VKAIYRPRTLIELAMVRSILAANDIPYFVHNAGYASLFPGIQMELLNVPTVMVPPSLEESARELLEAYIPDIQDHLLPSLDFSIWHLARMVIEGFVCGWFVPRIGVHEKMPAEP